MTTILVMSAPSNDVFTLILTQCAAAAPQPWYPSTYSGAGVSREALDAALNELRVGELIRLTDWVQGRGQGYVLTAGGEKVLNNPRLMKRLKEGVVPSPAPARDVPAPEGRLTPWERGEAVRAIWLDPARPIVSRVILFITIAYFFAGMMLAVQRGVSMEAYLNPSGSGPQAGAINEILGDLGAVSLHEVRTRHQWWRLLTHGLVHIGIIHLAMNMLALYSMGRMLETMWGPWRFLVLYLVSDLGAGVAVILTGSAAAGASGAICGLLVSTWVWVLLNYHHLPREAAAAFMQNIGFNMLLMVFISMMPGISWQGHLGGALAGGAVAFPMVYQRFEHGFKRRLGMLGMIAVPLVLVGLAWALTIGSLRTSFWF